jgi:hypothetical protein
MRTAGVGHGEGLQAIEQLVLQHLEAGDLGGDLGPTSLHRLGVTSSLAMVVVGKRRLGHQRTQPGVVGLLDEVRDLLVVDRKVGVELLESTGHVDQPTLDERSRHGHSVEPRSNHP